MKKIFIGVFFSTLFLFSTFIFASEAAAAPNPVDQEIIDAYNALDSSEAEANLESAGFSTLAKSINSHTYGDYFTTSRWITRDGVVSLHILARPLLYETNGNVRMAHANRAFSLLKSKHSSDSRWKNTTSLSVQFHCHVLGAAAVKTQWNIEPYRTTTSLTTTMRHGCNPPN